MSEPSVAPDVTTMSVDQAAGLIMPQDDTPAPVEAAAEDLAEEEPNPSEDASEAEEPGDGGEAEDEVAAEAVDPPQWWDAEAKAEFSKLTPETQAIVFAQEEKREAITAKAKQEAAEDRRAAQQQVQGVKRLADELASFLPKAVETFNQQWGEPDWAATVEQMGAEQAFILKSQYETQQRQLAQIAEAKQRADLEARQAELIDENEKLKGTPLEAVEARQPLAAYLASTGYAPAEISAATARDLLIAHKAMLYDKAQAALKAKPKTAPIAPAKSPVRPAAGQPGTPQTRNVSQIANRYAQTRSIDDAVALMLAKR